MNLSFNYFDYLLLIILLLSVLVGIWRGFVKEALSFFIWIMAFVLAFLFSSKLANFLSHYIQSDTEANILSFFAIFLLVLIIGKLLAALINKFLDRLCGVSLVNRLVGGCFGFARGVLIILVLIYLVALSPWQSREWFEQSQLVLWSKNVVKFMPGGMIVPGELSDTTQA